MTDFSFINQYNVLWFAATTLILFLLMFCCLWIGWLMGNRHPPISPYMGTPLRPASDLSYTSMGRVYKFMLGFHQYDNRMFDIHRMSFCRETGRLFFDSIDWRGRIRVDWNFLYKRYPGNYVSWGSLNSEQQKEIREKHKTFAGFQTDFSCPQPAPRAIEERFVAVKPGPLYVDLDTNILLGWKIVPGTELEVLIVQKPIEK